MTAADGRYLVAHRPEQLDRLVIVAGLVGDHALAQRNENVARGLGAPSVALRGKCRHRFDMTARRVKIAVGGKRETEMRIPERQHVVVNALCRMFGERLPALADVDAVEFDAFEQRGLVRHIDIGFGIHRAERLVVEVERPVGMALRQQKQRCVPPDVGLERILVRPLFRRVVEPFDAFGRTALHFQHMSDGMNGPEIAGVPLDRLAPPPLRFVIGAAFFQGIGVHALHAAVFRDRVVPLSHDACHHRPHDLTAAGVEGHGVVELERQEVERKIRQDLFPVETCPHDVAGRPCRPAP